MPKYYPRNDGMWVVLCIVLVVGAFTSGCIDLLVWPAFILGVFLMLKFLSS